ncbi:hypothetical protein [Gordonia sp. NPDC003376]
MNAVRRGVVGVTIAASVMCGGFGVAQAIPPSELNGSVTDASTDVEVANEAYRDLTMNRFTYQEATVYLIGDKTAVQATASLNQHLGRYCAAARMISTAIADLGYNSATIQNFYYESGCMNAPSVTHEGPTS